MKYLLFSLLMLGSSLEIFSGFKKEKNALLVESWQKEHMPFTNPKTQQPYNFKKFSWLALLCGPVVMLESALRPQSLSFNIRQKGKRKEEFDIRLHLLEKEPKLDSYFIKDPKDRSHR